MEARAAKNLEGSVVTKFCELEARLDEKLDARSTCRSSERVTDLEDRFNSTTKHVQELLEAFTQIKDSTSATAEVGLPEASAQFDGARLSSEQRLVDVEAALAKVSAKLLSVDSRLDDCAQATETSASGNSGPPSEFDSPLQDKLRVTASHHQDFLYTPKADSEDYLKLAAPRLHADELLGVNEEHSGESLVDIIARLEDRLSSVTLKMDLGFSEASVKHLDVEDRIQERALRLLEDWRTEGIDSNLKLQLSEAFTGLAQTEVQRAVARGRDTQMHDGWSDKDSERSSVSKDSLERRILVLEGRLDNPVGVNHPSFVTNHERVPAPRDQSAPACAPFSL